MKATFNRLERRRGELSICIRCGYCYELCHLFKSSHWEGDTPRGQLVLAYGLLSGEILPSPYVAEKIFQCFHCKNCEKSCSANVPVTDIIRDARADLQDAGFAAEGSTAIIDDQLCGQVVGSMEVREVDRVHWPEAARAIEAHELLCPRGALTGERKRVVGLFGQGLTLFKQKKWREAMAIFEASAQGEGELKDWLSWRYRDRCWIRLEAPHFAELAELPKEDMEMLLRHVDQRDLLEAFRETDAEVREGFMRVMSQRVRRFLSEEMEAVDHTGYSKEEIAEKQNKIVDIAGWLAQEGRVHLDLGPRVADHRAVMDRIIPQLAADLSCPESALRQEGVRIVEAREMPGRRRFPRQEKSLTIATMGRGAVVACSAGRLEWVGKKLGSLDRHGLFSAATLALLQQFVARDGQNMAGPELKFVCSKDRLRPIPYTNWVQLEIYGEERMDELRRHTEFPHGPSPTSGADRPDVLACSARKEDRLVALACASADSNDFWQIGVDVLPEFRGKGIALEVVHELTRAILDRGKVPYYSTHVDNLASCNVAIRLGYWPAWTEIYARARVA